MNTTASDSSPTPAPLVIRADGSSTIGLGHVMRCIALAQAWQDVGGHVVFVTQSDGGEDKGDDWLKQRFAVEGFRSVTLPDVADRTTNVEDSSGRSELIRIARDERAAWVVLDGYDFSTSDHAAVRDAGFSLLVVDDHAHLNHYACDILLNQNHGASSSLYGSLTDVRRPLLGSRFSLLRREFRRGFRPRTFTGRLHEIVVCLGGSELAVPVTCRILDGLGQANLADDCLVRLVLAGRLSPEADDKLTALVEASPFSCQIERQVADMSRVFEQADLAIGAAGATSWERALTGLPSLIVTLADNQRLVAEQVTAAGAAVSLGWHEDVAAKEVAVAVRLLDESPVDRRAMSEAALALLDPWGEDRVVQQMLERELRYRPAASADCRLIWEWANDEQSRAMSFSGAETIPWQTHVDWFDAKMNDPHCHHWIACLADDRPVGQVRFDEDGECAVISVALISEVRGRGFGTQLIDEGTRRLFRQTAVRDVDALIRPENVASLRVFEKCGFTRQADTLVNGQPAIRMRRSRKG